METTISYYIILQYIRLVHYITLYYIRGLGVQIASLRPQELHIPPHEYRYVKVRFTPQAWVALAWAFLSYCRLLAWVIEGYIAERKRTWRLQLRFWGLRKLPPQMEDQFGSCRGFMYESQQTFSKPHILQPPPFTFSGATPCLVHLSCLC